MKKGFFVSEKRMKRKKLFKRKDLKRVKQKNKIEFEKSKNEKGTINKLTSVKDTLETKPGDDAKQKDEDSNDSRPDANFNMIKKEPITEDDEGFIGPKLPRLMTQEEIDVFREELLAKYKLW